MAQSVYTGHIYRKSVAKQPSPKISAGILEKQHLTLMEKPWHDTFGRQVFNQTKPTVFRNNDSLITLSFIAESSMAFIYKPDGDLNKLGNTVPPASLQPARWEVHTLVISGGFNTHFQHNPKAVQTSVCVRVCVLRRQQLHVSDVSAEFGTQREKKPSGPEHTHTQNQSHTTHKRYGFA